MQTAPVYLVLCREGLSTNLWIKGDLLKWWVYALDIIPSRSRFLKYWLINIFRMWLNFNHCLFAYIEIYIHNENILLKIRKWLFLQRLKGQQISYHLFFTCKRLHMAFKATCMVYYLVKKNQQSLYFYLKSEYFPISLRWALPFKEIIVV